MELSKTEWAEHLESWRRSGKSATEYCEDLGLKFGALRYWSGRIGRGKPAPRKKPEVRFAAVRRKSSTTAPLLERSWSGVRLRVGGTAIELNRGFDEATLSRVLGILSAKEEEK